MPASSGRLHTLTLAGLACWALLAPPLAQAQSNPVYKCPGNNFTNELTPAQAKQQGCTEVQGGNLTVIPSPAGPTGRSAPAPAARPADAQVPSTVQRDRDANARRILEQELRSEETRLAEMQKEFNDGEPDRRGDERNYQRYLDRVEQLRADIARKQADVTAIRRELSKLPPPPPR